MIKTGIYKIQSISRPDRCYIGSAVNIRIRWNLHLNSLNNNKHHSIKLQRHFTKYGQPDLLFSILLECERFDLLKNEQIFIDSYNPYFNICKIAGSSLGLKRTKEACQKNREKHLGAKNTCFGRKLSPEHKKILIESNTNRIVKESTKEKMRNMNLGKVHSEETKKKMSESSPKTRPWLKGRIPWNKDKKNIYSEETIQKIRDARNKQVFSEEAILKRGESIKKSWVLRKLRNAIAKDDTISTLTEQKE